MAASFKWSVFHDFPCRANVYRCAGIGIPFIKNLHGDKNSAYSKYMDDAIFKLPTPLLLSKVVDALDEIYRLMSGSQAADVRGDTYEYLLSKISQSGLNGQFRTPRHIIRMMVELMDPKADDVICDPACGTSGFLCFGGRISERAPQGKRSSSIARKGSLYEPHVLRLRHGPDHAPYRRDEHDGPRHR